MDEKNAPNASKSNGSDSTSISGEGRGSREKWGSQLDFILSCIGFAVGLGNVWRFPYLCYENGGGAFLIPYVIMLLIAGLPLFYLELALGQFPSLGPVAVWKISPIFTGVGIGMVINSAFVAIYYNIIIAWTIYYMISSCTTGPLPWASCDNDWNTPNCFNESMNYTQEETMNLTRPSDEFWHRKVHQLTDGIHDMGSIRLELLGCLAIAWVIVYLCLCKGIKSSGKVVYFTAIFPYVVLIILLVRGATLEGAGVGVEFYIKPVFAKLADAKPWKDAANQIFFSLGISFGSLTAMASYNRFHNNCQRDALIVSFVNCGTSILAGFVVFSTLGFMAVTSNRNVEDVVASGVGLAFIVYPEALTKLQPVPQVWSFLFFFMLLTLGLDSMFAFMETVITVITDALPPHYKGKKWLTSLGICFVGFLLGIPMVTQGGLYLLTIMNDYAGGFALMIIAVTYCVAVCYVYGLNRFFQDIKSMLGSTPNIYWKVTWAFVSPVAMTVVVIAYFIFYGPSAYSGMVLPPWSQAIGWLITLTAFVVIPGYALFAIARAEGPLLFRIKTLLKPTWDWGPAQDNHRIDAGYQPLLKDGMAPSKLEMKTKSRAKDPSIALVSSSSLMSKEPLSYEQAIQVDLY